MSTPLVSIIVPVYNVDRYLRRCLNSISRQTFTNWECLLINDGSTDRSGIICDEYAQKDYRFKAIHGVNSGVALARKKGVELAKGCYSIHVDSDDWVEHCMLEDMVNVMEKESLDMLVVDYYSEKNGIRSLHHQRPSQIMDEKINDLLDGTLRGFLWNKMLRHSLYKKCGVEFDKNINYGEDALVCLKLMMHNIAVGYLPQAYYHYCVNGDGITSNYTKETFSMRKNTYNTLVRRSPQPNGGGNLYVCL